MFRVDCDSQRIVRERSATLHLPSLFVFHSIDFDGRNYSCPLSVLTANIRLTSASSLLFLRSLSLSLSRSLTFPRFSLSPPIVWPATRMLRPCVACLPRIHFSTLSHLIDTYCTARDSRHVDPSMRGALHSSAHLPLALIYLFRLAFLFAPFMCCVYVPFYVRAGSVL